MNKTNQGQQNFNELVENHMALTGCTRGKALNDVAVTLRQADGRPSLATMEMADDAQRKESDAKFKHHVETYQRSGISRLEAIGRATVICKASDNEITVGLAMRDSYSAKLIEEGHGPAAAYKIADQRFLRDVNSGKLKSMGLDPAAGVPSGTRTPATAPARGVCRMDSKSGDGPKAA